MTSGKPPLRRGKRRQEAFLFWTMTILTLRPAWRRGALRTVTRPERALATGGHRPITSGYFAPVDHHSERIGDDEDADAPGKGDPDLASDRLLREQVSDRVDNRGDRLVFREGSHGTRHRGRGHECRADERQEDDRVREG